MPFDGKLYDLVNSKADRLSYMADFLEGEPEERLYMEGYYSWGSNGDARLQTNSGCRTAACVCGWAVVLPAFKFLELDTPTEFHALASQPWGLTGRELEDLVQGYSYPRKRPDGEPFKADVVARLRHYAELVRSR